VESNDAVPEAGAPIRFEFSPFGFPSDFDISDFGFDSGSVTLTDSFDSWLPERAIGAE
jgi:hypothetical protein